MRKKSAVVAACFFLDVFFLAILDLKINLRIIQRRISGVKIFIFFIECSSTLLSL